MIDLTNISDRLYWWISQNWHLFKNPRYRLIMPMRWCFALPDEISDWCWKNIPSRFRHVGGELQFKHQADLVLFSLRWSEELAVQRARDDMLGL